jgi:hypothetical protein
MLTAKQQETLELVATYGMRGAARELGLGYSSIQDRMRVIKRQQEAATQSPAPEPLPPPDLPFSERLDQLKTRNKTRIAHERAKAWQTVRIPVEGPYGICWFGDPHLDDPYCDLEAIEEHAAICARTEGLYGANGGDSVNNWVGRLEKLHAFQNVTQEEAWELVDWFMNGLGVKWLLWILGNHDTWNHGLPIFMKTNTQGILMRDWDAKMRLVSPCGGELKVWARHDFKGTSIYNELHGLKRAAMMDERADIYAAFHRHTFAQGQGELPGGREYCIIRARGYKEVDHYATLHQFHEQRNGQSVVTVIEPRNGAPPLIHTFRDVHRGADFLTMIRQQWKDAQG